MRALTIRQPWASLIALGVKHIETRSWSTRYRGPLAIHAGAKRPPVFWHRNVNDDVPPAIDLVAMSGCWQWTEHDDFHSGGDYRWVGPLGAVVAVADLVDVVPMIDGSLGWTEDSDTPPAALVLSWDTSAMLVDTRATGPFPDYSDQLPYGDFSPGRYAWLLDNVRPIDPPIPAKGRQGLWQAAPKLRLEVSKAAHVAELAVAP